MNLNTRKIKNRAIKNESDRFAITVNQRLRNKYKVDSDD
jgi:excinuclease UvrABC nuclease subunit